MTEKKLYTIAQAIEFIKENCKCKFNATIEAHINLDVDTKKDGHSTRYTTILPHGTGKTKKVAVFASKKVAEADLELSENDLDKIASGDIKPKIDFDVLVSEPKFMAKLAKVAKILGPAGVMPNPKTGTVTEDVDTAVKQIKTGKIEIRIEPNAAVIHTIIGKKSFENKALEENLEKVLASLRQNKPAKAKPQWIKSCFIKSTMSKAAEIDPKLL